MEIQVDNEPPVAMELDAGVRMFADARAAHFRPTPGAAGSWVRFFVAGEDEPLGGRRLHLRGRHRPPGRCAAAPPPRRRHV
jgi:hypothetical protein